MNRILRITMSVLQSVAAQIEPPTQDNNVCSLVYGSSQWTAYSKLQCLFSSLWQLTVNRLHRITMSVLESRAAHNEPRTQDYNVCSLVCGSSQLTAYSGLQCLIFRLCSSQWAAYSGLQCLFSSLWKLTMNRLCNVCSLVFSSSQ